MTELESLLILNSIDGIGSIRLQKLLEHFKDAAAILKASKEELKRVDGIPESVIQNIISLKGAIDIKKELELIKKEEVSILTIKDKDYPENLKSIYDPPAVLYVKGRIIETDVLSIAIVGSRNASFYGLSMAEKLSRTLAGFNFTIVSGFARGIDTVSHKAALKAGGRTIAVLGSGFSNIYPPENKGLLDEVIENGAVITEFPFVTKPFAGNFPRRNRLISGLSLGVVIVEAAKNSGALITADFALEQGREVQFIPQETCKEIVESGVSPLEYLQILQDKILQPA